MAAQGATLQNYNNELVKCVDDLKEKREEVNKAILKDVRAALPTACQHSSRGARDGGTRCQPPCVVPCRRRRRTRSRTICAS